MFCHLSKTPFYEGKDHSGQCRIHESIGRGGLFYPSLDKKNRMETVHAVKMKKPVLNHSEFLCGYGLSDKK